MFRLRMILNVFLVVLLWCPTVMASGWIEVDAHQVRRMMVEDDPLVIFPLSRIEFNDLHIEGSLNIPLGRLEEMLPPDRERKLVFYCLGPKCTATPQAADLAVRLGYLNVYAFSGGLPAWKAAGYPIRSVDPLPEVTVPGISARSLAAMLTKTDGVVILDVRQPHDAAKGLIDAPGRTYIPLDDLFARRREIPRGEYLVVCCQKGKRASTAARYLIGKQFKNVHVLEGGVASWQEAGYAVVNN